jgi:signal transduction histidine kinase
VLRRWWGDLPLRRKGAAVVAIPIVALLVTVLLLLISARRSRVDREWVNHTLRVKEQLARVLTILIDAETGARGYVLVGSRDWLKPTDDASAALPQEIDRLAGMVADSPEQRARAGELRRTADLRLASLQRLVTDFDGNGGALSSASQIRGGKALMDQFRAVVETMVQQENRNLAERIPRARQSQVRLFLVLLLGAIVGIGGALIAAYLFTNSIAKRIRLVADNAVRVAHGEQVTIAPEGGDEVGQLARAVGDASELLAAQRRELEVRLAEVAAVNGELEAFSYSVSHDLRAPVRHISGFVSMLEQSMNGSMTETTRRHLTTIATAAQRMGRLIVDLLAFSRAGRATMAPSLVNLNALVRDVRDELAPDSAGREIEWVTPPLPAVAADPAMLRLVMANLLANAVKYTRTRGRARIEVSGTEQNGEVVVTVRDNGVGFDMQYAHKLFGVFQRLHRVDEFEGTGIGLANVRRIVARHGGRTWAEGQVDGGATFAFSLPASHAHRGLS